jgi:hypothetical protein
MIRNEELAIFSLLESRKELQRLGISGVLQVLAAGTAKMAQAQSAR